MIDAVAHVVEHVVVCGVDIHCRIGGAAGSKQPRMWYLRRLGETDAVADVEAGLVRPAAIHLEDVLSGPLVSRQFALVRPFGGTGAWWMAVTAPFSWAKTMSSGKSISRITKVCVPTSP